MRLSKIRQFAEASGLLTSWPLTSGGGRYPSVSAVLSSIDKPGLNSWKMSVVLNSIKRDLGNMQGSMVGFTPSLIDAIVTRASDTPGNIAETSAKFGNEAHDAINKLVKGESFDVGSQSLMVQTVVKNFNAWKQQSSLELLPQGDTLVYSHKYQYAGYLDCVARDRDSGAFVILDFKTTNSTQPAQALQVAAYAAAWEEMQGCELPLGVPEEHPYKVTSAMLVRLNKAEDGFEVVQIKDLAIPFSAFKAALMVWNLMFATDSTSGKPQTLVESTMEVVHPMKK